MGYTRRFDFKDVPEQQLWADVVAERIIAVHPDQEMYTTAAGISPSGVVHFGNFRDIVTAHLVREALKKKGKKARLLFSWDNFDRFRKVPSGVPESFVEHIGKPLSKIPDPVGVCHASYAEHFQEPFIEAMKTLDIDIEYRNQTTLHESGVYDEAIILALKKRDIIADILLSFMTEKAKGEKGINVEEYRNNYYPISIYSRFTGKDLTKILNYDNGSIITYLCVETGKEDTIDLSQEHIAKLAWKPDWAMRWKHEQVHFEPAGHDHASPGGSYDTSSEIVKRIFDYDAPIFVEYKFVGIQGLGSKMSGSKGNAVSPLDLLDIYEPDLLKWLYFKKSPNQSFELAFNSEIYRQYDEYDREKNVNAIPFRQAVSFGQIVQWDEEKLGEILKGLNYDYSTSSITSRVPRARAWLTKYNADDVITLRANVNAAYVETMSSEQKKRIMLLKSELAKVASPSVGELESLVYQIPRTETMTKVELKKEQRAFFKDVYNLLISKDTGPRLGTFLWALNAKDVLALLDV